MDRRTLRAAATVDDPVGMGSLATGLIGNQPVVSSCTRNAAGVNLLAAGGWVEWQDIARVQLTSSRLVRLCPIRQCTSLAQS